MKILVSERPDMYKFQYKTYISVPTIQAVRSLPPGINIFVQKTTKIHCISLFVIVRYRPHIRRIDFRCTLWNKKVCQLLSGRTTEIELLKEPETLILLVVILVVDLGK